jgi:hypothetical protein
MEPFILFHVLGLGKDQKDVLNNDNFFVRDHTMSKGAGVWPYTFNCSSVSTQTGAHTKIQELAAHLAHVRASRLIINVNAHMSQGLGYMLGTVPYSETQVLDLILRPLMHAFRVTQGRGPHSPVAVLFNACDANYDTWDQLLQAESELYRFDAVVCTNPVLLHDIPGVLSGFAREYTNAVSFQQPNFDAATALSHSMTYQFALETKPVVLRHGAAPVTQFAMLAPAGAAPLGQLSLQGVSAFGAVSSPPLVSAWTNTERNQAVIGFIGSLPPSARAEMHFSNVTEQQLAVSFNSLAAYLATATHHTCVLLDGSSASVETFRKFVRKHWTMDSATRNFFWKADAAAAASGLGSSASSLD